MLTEQVTNRAFNDILPATFRFNIRLFQRGRAWVKVQVIDDRHRLIVIYLLLGIGISISCILASQAQVPRPIPCAVDPPVYAPDQGSQRRGAAAHNDYSLEPAFSMARAENEPIEEFNDL